MEITIKIKNQRELDRLRKLLQSEKLVIISDRKKKGHKKTVNKINEITEEVFRKTNKGEDLIVCKNVNDLFKKLGI